MTRKSQAHEFERDPKHIAIDVYAERCEQQFRGLLSRDPSETEVQEFLEKHPWLVPGHRTPTGTSGHYPLHCILIAQPRLPGREVFIPDFMWIATHSGAWYPTLVEIERPEKRIFNKDGTPSADFTKARNQLAQWRAWFNDPANIQQFIDFYGIPSSLRQRTRHLHMILIYGRQSEFEQCPTLVARRGSLLPGHDEELMSYDRIDHDIALPDAIAVTAVGQGKFRALWVPTTFATGAFLAERLLHIGGLSEAIGRNPEIPIDRKDFLNRRIIYWKEWAASSRTTEFHTGHRE